MMHQNRETDLHPGDVVEVRGRPDQDPYAARVVRDPPFHREVGFQTEDGTDKVEVEYLDSDAPAQLATRHEIVPLRWVRRIND